MTTGRINQITILSLLRLLALKEGSSRKISQVFKRFNSSNDFEKSLLEATYSKLERIQECYCSFLLLFNHQLDQSI